MGQMDVGSKWVATTEHVGEGISSWVCVLGDEGTTGRLWCVCVVGQVRWNWDMGQCVCIRSTCTIIIKNK